MACSSILTEITKGKSIREARHMSKDDVLGELGLENLQAVRIKCALLSLKVLKFALYSYLARDAGTTDGGSNSDDSGDDDDDDASKLKQEAADLY